MLTAKKFKLINKYEFVKTVLDENANTFVIYVATLGAPKSTMLIQSLQALLLATIREEDISSKISKKYKKYTNVFSSDLAMELSENIKINKHEIEQVKGK